MRAEEVVMASFRGRVRRWREDKPGGLAVVDIPAELVAGLGGRRQMRVAGSLNGVAFTGSTMLVAGGGFCVGVSRAALKAARLAEGDEVEVEVERAKD
jgi:antitoxin component of MazEF toxin-antitoxin module